jgi:hypothetical protein
VSTISRVNIAELDESPSEDNLSDSQPSDFQHTVRN